METDTHEIDAAPLPSTEADPSELEQLRHEAKKLREIRRLTNAVDGLKEKVEAAKAAVRERRKELAEGQAELNRVLGEKDEFFPLFDKSPLQKLREKIFDTLQHSGPVNTPYLAGMLNASEEQIERAVKHEWFTTLGNGAIAVAKADD